MQRVIKKRKKLLSIVVPVYNNESSLALLSKEIDKIKTELLSLSVRIEVIFVDDGSNDDSWLKINEIAKSSEGVSCIKLTRNFGSIAASRTGIEHTSGDCITILSADLQDPPQMIVEMAKSWCSGNELTVCQRVRRADPWGKKLWSKLFYFFLRKFVMKDYPEQGYDLFLIDSKYKSVLLDSNKFSYASILVWWIGVKPHIIEYNRMQRIGGQSQWSLGKRMNLALDIFLGFSIKPIRTLFFSLVAISFLSLVYSCAVLLYTVFNGSTVQGWPSIMVLLSSFFGLLFFSLGVVSEYLWRVYYFLNGRPSSVIQYRLLSKSESTNKSSNQY